MTIEELNKRLDGLIQSWDNGFTPLYLAVSTIKGDMGVRIFDEGTNSAGTKLPQPSYSTKPLYADIKSLPSEPTAYQVGKRGKKIKSVYFPAGYSQLKQVIGRPVLELNNRLDLAFSNFNVLEPSAYVAQIAVPDDERGKIQGLEKKYGAIFDLTDDELKTFTSTLDFEIQEALNRALQ